MNVFHHDLESVEEFCFAWDFHQFRRCSASILYNGKILSNVVVPKRIEVFGIDGKKLIDESDVDNVGVDHDTSKARQYFDIFMTNAVSFNYFFYKKRIEAFVFNRFFDMV